MFVKLVIVFFVLLSHINQAYSKTYISQVGPNFSYPWGISKIDNENVLITEKRGKLKTSQCCVWQNNYYKKCS